MTYRHLWLLALGLAAVPCSAQSPRELQGLIFHLGENGQRVAEKRVEIEITETGASDVSNDKGLFRLPLADFYEPGDSLTLSVSKKGWILRYPLEGEVRIPRHLRKSLVLVELLPKGSKLFWTNDRIEKLISDTARRSVQEARSTESQRPLDFSRAIKEWAIRYGLKPEEAKDEVDRWIAEVHATSQDERKKGLAAFAESSFGLAAEHFAAAARESQERLDSLKSEEEKIREQQAQLRTSLVHDLWLLADARFNEKKYRDSAEAAEKALGLVEPDSTKPAAILQWQLGKALSELAEREPSDKGLEDLDRAVLAMRAALKELRRESDFLLWAGTQLDLGIALLRVGERRLGAESVRALTEARDAFRSSAECFTRDKSPETWAGIQSDLGWLLIRLADRVPISEGAQLLTEAVATLKLGLEVATREKKPQAWAAAQNNLGTALAALAARKSGEAAAEQLAQAVVAYRLALEERTFEHSAWDWALTQASLGGVLADQGKLSSGEDAVRLLREGMEALQAALRVFTREQAPQQWAVVQLNRGGALLDLVDRTRPEDQLAVLAEAAAALRLALEELTPGGSADWWSKAQNNLGSALAEMARRQQGPAAISLFEEAHRAFSDSLKGRSPQDSPRHWATAQVNRGNVLVLLAQRETGAEAGQRLAEAKGAYEQALAVYKKDGNTALWASTQMDIARALALAGRYDEALEHLRAALDAKKDDTGIFMAILEINQELLFDYPTSLRLLSEWLSKHPEDRAARVQLAETAFLAGDTALAAETSTRLLPDLTDPIERSVALSYAVASLLELGRSSEAKGFLGECRHLVSSQDKDFRMRWSFTGILHFIDVTPTLQKREALRALFEALSSPHRDAILAELTRVEELLSAEPKK